MSPANPTRVKIEGRHAVSVGDTVRVVAAVFTHPGVPEPVVDRGWSGARVVRFVPGRGGLMLAEVTVVNRHGQRAATRTVDAGRLVRMRGQR